jgi:hypothetical protein
MRQHVKRFIRDCACCQKMSYLKIPIHTHPFTVACYEPFERLDVDTIGPRRILLYISNYLLFHPMGEFISNKRIQPRWNARSE